MKLAGTDPDRNFGLVYRDDALAAGPATHVLIIGVGAYQSSRFKKPLTSTTFSARALADWFVGDTPGFRNEACPLGSLALLLSEPAAGGDPRATYADGPVPRASFAASREAVRAWVRRINTHKDNLAILYVAGHGESLLSRTAFLLEDYAMDDLDATAGMSEVEQFMSALENAKAVSQLLLFDCCRSATNLALPWNEPFGSKLIALTRENRGHDEPSKQWVIAATTLGEVAGGRVNNTTLFADALLSALGGVAGDPAEEDWPVRPGPLVDSISRLLELHRLPDEKPQTPGGRISGTFEISFAGERAEIPVYISMAEPENWPESDFTVTAVPGGETAFEGATGKPPFQLLKYPEATAINVSARRFGADIGRAKGKARAPAVFLEIRHSATPPPAVVEKLDPGRRAGPAARLLISLSGPVAIAAGAVAEIAGANETKKSPKQVVVAIGGATPVDVGPGEHVVTLRTPDGRVEIQNVTVAKDEVLEVRFAMPASPHEWLGLATATGAVPPSPPPDPSPPAPAPGLESLRPRPSADVDSSAPPLWQPGFPRPAPPPVIPVIATIAGHVDYALGLHALADPRLAAAIDNDDGRLAQVGLADAAAHRFAPFESSTDDRPVFVAIEAGPRRNLAVVPSIAGRWRPYVLVDRQAPREKSMVTIIAENSIWSGLIGFLAARDAEAGSRLLAGGLQQAVIDAMQDKLADPIAALAAALIAVSASPPELERRWDPWLFNLANWFPLIPDGPIILGRRLLMRASTAKQFEQAKARFLEGFSRGAPLYSLSADWLARGLESLPDEKALEAPRHAARAFANRVDSTQAFTVIRLGD
ncbi:caspase family protein [Labrys sp. 22185]|uniref:caspase family protein n=1 Tax=Labrys sp. 22185 TaxID=3453888 RepID=UPI003F85DF15